MNNAQLDEIALDADRRRGETLANRLFITLGRFVAYPNEDAQVAHTLWILHTHLMDSWESTPRLAFLSAEPGSGKTRSLELTEHLVPGAVNAVNVSPAYLFRKVGGDELVTILFDEIDTVLGPKAKENEEIRGLLNAGHRKGAKAGRCVVKGKEIVTEEIPAYAAVAMAGLGWLPDTILNRSVIVRMRRRRADQTVEQFRSRIHAPQLQALRHEIEIWARSLGDFTSDPEFAWPHMPDTVQDRAADVWEPLVAVAELCGGEWPRRAREAAIWFVAAAADIDESSLGVKLLADIKTVFGDRSAMPKKQLLTELLGLEDSPWLEIERGNPMTERGLSLRLRAFEISQTSIRVLGAVAKGYRHSDFADAWSRYLPRAPEKAAQALHGYNGQDCNAVTDVTDSPAMGGEPDPDDWSFHKEGAGQ